jgi:hypothetical protein
MKTLCITLIISLFAGVIGTAASVHASQDVPPKQGSANLAGLHDFDFLFGEWRVHHRRLKERLAGSHEWVEFEGTCSSRPLMDGYANVDDNVLNLPDGAYRGVGLRSYDPKTAQWAIWWLDGRNPFGDLDPPVKGGFEHGVGNFYSTDTLRGKAVGVRFTWSHITSVSAHWEQAYSPDGGKSWETNWKMEFTRVR